MKRAKKVEKKLNAWFRRVIRDIERKLIMFSTGYCKLIVDVSLKRCGSKRSRFLEFMLGNFNI